MADVVQMEDFKLGRPALVCRWRLSGGAVPLLNRHLRALGMRRVNGVPVSTQLVAWAKQHLEWTLKDGSVQNPDGVLMLVVDEEGKAAMTVGPYEPLRVRTSSMLAERALASAREAEVTGVSPETLWAVRGNVLVWGISSDEKPSGTGTLMRDLAETIGFGVVHEEGLARALLAGTASVGEVFLVSDEHGVVPATNASGPRSRRFAEGYAKLLAKERG